MSEFGPRDSFGDVRFRIFDRRFWLMFLIMLILSIGKSIF
jgi:hypothetical protein